VVVAIRFNNEKDNQVDKVNELNSKVIAELALGTIAGLTPPQQDLIFQTKKEQTFSSLLAGGLQSKFDPSELRALVELKGKEKIVKGKDKAVLKKNRNTHDVALIDSQSNFQLILENKVWYHFDGAKGRKNKKINSHIDEQLVPDIYKLRLTATHQNTKPKCFVLLNLVTPSVPSLLPAAYFGDHEKAFKRVHRSIEQYRSDGIEGVRSVFDKHTDEISNLIHLGSEVGMGIEGTAMVDIFCAEVTVQQ
jgi:hypothetical protein